METSLPRHNTATVVSESSHVHSQYLGKSVVSLGHRWISEGDPDDLRFGVRQARLADLPNLVRDARRFIVDQDDPLLDVVQPLEGLRVVLVPGHKVRAPYPLVLGGFHRNAGRL